MIELTLNSNNTIHAHDKTRILLKEKETSCISSINFLTVELSGENEMKILHPRIIQNFAVKKTVFVFAVNPKILSIIVPIN